MADATNGIITEIHSRNVRGTGLGGKSYKTTLVLSENATPAQAEDLAKALVGAGCAIYPTQLGNGRFAFKVEAPEGSVAGPHELDAKLKNAIGGFINESAVAQNAASSVSPPLEEEPTRNPLKAAARFVSGLIESRFASGSREQRYKMAMAFYGIGDVSGVLNGALVNHDMNDAAFAALAGQATVLGFIGNELEDGKSLAEKVRDKAVASLNPDTDYSGDVPGTPQNVGEAVTDQVKAYGKDVFNFSNWASFVPLFRAGVKQGNVPKIIAGTLGLSSWSIRSLVPRRGDSGVLDMEQATETLGLQGARDFLNDKVPGGKLITDTWDKIRDDPKKISSRIDQIRNIFMGMITFWDWTVSPAATRILENRYHTGEDSLEKQSREGKTTLTEKMQGLSSRVFGLFMKKPPKAEEPKRFHQCDESGKVVKHWWEMKFEELETFTEHLKNNKVVADDLLKQSPDLKRQGCISESEFDSFCKETHKYWSKKRLIIGGLGNLLMISSYYVANTILGKDNPDAPLNLHELYAELALSAMAEKPGEARVARVEQLAKDVARIAEVREHTELRHLDRDALLQTVKDGITQALDNFQKSPFRGMFQVKGEQAAQVDETAAGKTIVQEAAAQLTQQTAGIGEQDNALRTLTEGETAPRMVWDKMLGQTPQPVAATPQL